MAKAIPDGYCGATPYLCCRGAAEAIEFYKRAFGAVELYRIGNESMIGHAEIKIGDAVIMLADEFPQMGFLSPESIGGTPVTIHLYVPDVDALAARAVAAGGKLVRPVEDQFYGDRSCKIQDPCGHVWSFGTHIEDVSVEEIKRRAKEKYGM